MNPAQKWTSLLFAFFLAVSTSVCHSEFQVRSLSNLGIPIPDNEVQGVTVPFDFRGAVGNVSYIAVSFDGDGPNIASNADPKSVGITHEYISDLTATLIAPNGNEIELFSNPTDNLGGKNFSDTVFARIPNGISITDAVFEDSPFDSFYDVSGPIEDLYSIPADGVWFIRVADVSRQDEGSLQAVSLFLETGETILGDLPPIASINNPIEAHEFNGLQVTFDGIAADHEEDLVSVQYAVNLEFAPVTNWQTATNVSGDWTQWTFDANLTDNVRNTVSVRSLDADGNYSVPATRSALAVAKLENPPLLAIHNPSSEATQTIGPNVVSFPFEVTGTAQGNNGMFGFEYREAFGNFTFIEADQLGESISSQTISFPLNVPQNTSKAFEFRAVDTRGATSEIVTRTLFRTNQNTRPSLVIVTPSDDRFIAGGIESFDFSGTAFDIDGIIDLVEFRVTYPETFYMESSYDNITDWMPADDSSTDAFAFSKWDFTVPDLVQGIIDVEVRALDSELTGSAVRTRRLTVDPMSNEKPVVTINSPEDTTIFPNEVESLTVSGVVLVTEIPVEFLTYELLTPSGPIPSQLITDTNPTKTAFSFQIPLEVGQTVINVSAENQVGNVSTVNTVSQIIVVRESLDFFNPRISVTFPALSLQKVPNATTQIMVSGKTTPGTLDIQDVQYQFGTDISDLSQPIVAQSVKNNFEEWTVSFPLELLTNYIRVTAFDVEGNQSTSVLRTIQRFPITPTITITDPFSDIEIAADINEVAFTGTTIDPDNAITIVQYRVTTEGSFNSDKSFEKAVTSPWLSATDTSDEEQDAWSSFAFDAPVGNGSNLVEVRTQNGEIGELARTSRNVTQYLSDFYMFY